MGNHSSTEKHQPAHSATKEMKFLRPPTWKESSAFTLMITEGGGGGCSGGSKREGSSSDRSLDRVPAEVLSTVIGYMGHEFAVLRMVNRHWFRAVVVHLEDYLSVHETSPNLPTEEPNKSCAWEFKEWKNKYSLVCLPGMSQVVLRSVRVIDLSKWYLVTDQSLLLLISLLGDLEMLLEARRRLDPEHEEPAVPAASSERTEFQHACNVSKMSLYNCSTITDGSVMEIARLTSLSELDLSKCNGITDRSLKEIAKLPWLKFLNLSGCHRITGVGLVELGKSKSLEKFSFRNCRAPNEQGIAELAKIPTLADVDFSWSNLGDGSLQHLTSLSQLRSLSADGCFVSDASIGNIAKSLKLQTLSLNKCDLIDGWLTQLAQLKSLKELSLAGNTLLTDRGINAIAEGLPQLQKLDISACPLLTDASFGLVGRGMPSLKSLNLSKSGITDEGLMKLSGYCAQLAVLYLEDCQRLTDAASMGISSFPKLAHMSIRFCEGLTDGAIHQLQRLLPTLQIEQEKAVKLTQLVFRKY
jgi:Leucine-rich repeat (LRR) protein